MPKEHWCWSRKLRMRSAKIKNCRGWPEYFFKKKTAFAVQKIIYDDFTLFGIKYIPSNCCFIITLYQVKLFPCSTYFSLGQLNKGQCMFIIALLHLPVSLCCLRNTRKMTKIQTPPKTCTIIKVPLFLSHPPSPPPLPKWHYPGQVWHTHQGFLYQALLDLFQYKKAQIFRLGLQREIGERRSELSDPS